jgi:hypothetical protein
MNQQAIPRATHDGPLDMAGWVLHSYVLDDGRRVLSGRGFMAAFDIRSKANGIAPRLEKILNEHIMYPLIYQDILAPLQNPFASRTRIIGSPSAIRLNFSFSSAKYS